MNSFRTLDLAIQTYHACVALKLSRHLKDQLLRASSSVALNLSEGRGRRTQSEQEHFFSIAYGSLKETQTILVLARLEDHESYKLSDITGAHLYRLIKNLK